MCAGGHDDFRHPTGLGDLLEAVAYEKRVYDHDGDAVIEARFGNLDGIGNSDEGDDEGIATCRVSYHYTAPCYQDDYLPRGERMRHEAPKTETARWHRWLIAKTDKEKPVTDDELAEVRKSLGLEV